MRLSLPASDGATVRDHLLAAARITGRPDEDLLAQPPPGCEMLLAAFADLHRSRIGSEVRGIAQTEVAAWQHNFGVRLSAAEVECLMAMDNAAVRVMADHQRRSASR